MSSTWDFDESEWNLTTRRFTDHEVCFCYNEDSFTLVDVTDKNNMYMISKAGYTNVAYTHQVRNDK